MTKWETVLTLDSQRQPESGSTTDLADAIRAGADLRVGTTFRHNEHIDPTSDSNELIREVMDHEVFIHLGACYYYTDTRLLTGSANPVVRTRPSIPLGYSTQAWDFGWLMPRTDGHVARWLCDPYTLKFRRDARRYEMRPMRYVGAVHRVDQAHLIDALGPMWKKFTDGNPTVCRLPCDER